MDLPEIRYQCQRCGNCCRWPGEVVLHDAEIRSMAAHLGESEHDFIQNRTALRRARSGLTLAKKADGSCTLLDGKTCTVHEVKPAQCRAFPNTWRFPGWRQLCEATPERKLQACAPNAARPPSASEKKEGKTLTGPRGNPLPSPPR